MTWQAGLAANIAIAVSYGLISWIVARALARTGQLRTNHLGVATAMIFASCSAGHLGHALHLIGWSSGPVQTGAARMAYDPHLLAFDAATALVACWYLLLRRDFAKLLDGPKAAMFADQTALLHEAMLRAERDEAASAASAKTQFLANMSHELRTPLNGVVGAMDLLLHSDLDDEQRHYAHLALTSADSLTALLADLLDTISLDDGTLDVCVGEADVEAIVRDAVTMASASPHAAGLDVGIDVDGGGLIATDALRLRRVLAHLVDNALKFTDAGSVRVRLQRADPWVTISVTDTGVGIPAEDLARLFDVFTAADESSTRRHEGIGLGLALVDRLVRALGGQVTVASTVGVGSTFAIRLPVDGPGKPAAAPLTSSLVA